MVPELKGFALTFRTSHQLFRRALDGLTDEQAREAHPGANPIAWIAAHVVSTRASFARGLGATLDIPWASQFPRGGAVENVTTWPTLAEVLATWDTVHAAFMERLEALTSEQLAASTKIPGLDDTLLGAMALAMLHDSYHVGQISAARRRYGLSRVVG